MRAQERPNNTPLWAAAIIGGVLGIFVGRGTVNHSPALLTLSEALARQQRISTAAPVIAVGLSAAASIVNATLSVAVVWWIIWRTEKQKEDP